MKHSQRLFVLVLSLAMASTAQAGIFRKLAKGAAIMGVAVITAKALKATANANQDTPNSAGPTSQQHFSARVIGVSDGDTVVVESAQYGKTTIRLRGIDAPETNCHDLSTRDLSYCTERKQPYGKEAKTALAQMVMNTDIEVVTGKQELSHGRTVANLLKNRQDINLEMVKLGYAWHEPKLTPDETLREKIVYGKAMANAKSQHLGLWQEQNPMRPADYRKSSGS